MSEIAAYGGSFDPCTLGHYHLIAKASSIFDCVYVILAENPTKKAKAMFSDYERLSMLKDMANLIDSSGNKVKIAINPSSIYLANFAHSLGAKFLIRGIRDQLDFGYEQNIYRTNRHIQPNVETLYLMPDDSYSLVSSSWIKALIGCNGWVKVIKDNVTPFVLQRIMRYYLRNKFIDLMNHSAFSHMMRNDPEIIWAKIESAYESKKYHNYKHLINMFEALDQYSASDSLTNFVMKYAIFFHDVDPSEEKSVKMANNNIRILSKNLAGEDIKDTIKRLIMSTKHETCEYSNRDEQVIASIDLSVLSSSPSQYEEYVSEVWNEYLENSQKTKEEFTPLWIKGRSDFLKNMLVRRVIYPLDSMKELEVIARNNMQNELKSYENT